jgi:sporulation protein YlmC with PRC-barrel domain
VEIASWIAPAATMIAAIMTAANLGSRVTGWGFAVFSVGAVAWVVVAIATGQSNLLISNAFLLIVDVFGVWRWLGRRARYDTGAEAAQAESRVAPTPALFALGKLEGMPVRSSDGTVIGTVVDAMATCSGGTIAYLVVREGGIGGVGERLHALRWDEIAWKDGALTVRLQAEELVERPIIDPAQWPASARAAA